MIGDHETKPLLILISEIRTRLTKMIDGENDI